MRERFGRSRLRGSSLKWWVLALVVVVAAAGTTWFTTRDSSAAVQTTTATVGTGTPISVGATIWRRGAGPWKDF